MIPDRITFRPGPLAGAMDKRLSHTGETPSQYLRRLVAADLGKPVPDMPEGNPAFREQTKQPKRKAKK